MQFLLWSQCFKIYLTIKLSFWRFFRFLSLFAKSSAAVSCMWKRVNLYIWNIQGLFNFFALANVITLIRMGAGVGGLKEVGTSSGCPHASLDSGVSCTKIGSLWPWPLTQFKKKIGLGHYLRSSHFKNTCQLHDR